MRTIWKYPLQSTDVQSIGLPEGAKILTVQVQQDEVCMWACVNPNKQLEPRTIHIYGTGYDVQNSEQLKYISTFQLHNGNLVFHAFELE